MSFPFFSAGYPLWCAYGQQNVVVVPRWRGKKGCNDVVADGFDYDNAVVAGHLKPKVVPIKNGLLVARVNPKAAWTRAAFIDDFQAQEMDGELVPIVVDDGTPLPKEILSTAKGGNFYNVFGGTIGTIGDGTLGVSVIVMDPPSTVIRKRKISDEEMSSALKKIRRDIDGLIDQD